MQLGNISILQTFNVNQQTPDSASTASALYSGIKTIHDTLGYDSSIIYDNATSMLTANKVSNILIWAQEVGKDTGEIYFFFHNFNYMLRLI